MSSQDPKCSRCGCALKIEVVRVPVFAVQHSAGGGHNTKQEISHYAEREEVSDCPRCTGAY